MKLNIWPLLGLSMACFICHASPVAFEAQVHYSTGFEPSEGFDARFTLDGQAGWQADGTGGNGLLFDAFPGRGQQGFVGFYPPLGTDTSTTLFHPSNVPLPSLTNRVVQFDVTMQILASTNKAMDDFRWSVYNSAAKRLFSIDFETSTHKIYYLLDDGVPVFTQFTFDHSGTYDLRISLDFRKNRWAAVLNGFVLASSEPITTRSLDLNLGDIDAVWLINDPKLPGNNYMVFDDYTIRSIQAPSIPPVLEPVRLEKNGEFFFLVHGQEGLKYDVEVTSDFKNWFLLQTVTAPAGGTFQFQDTTSPGEKRSFYSVRQALN